MDASQKMVEASSKLTGQNTLLMRFEEINFENEFDGVWACASLLHVSKTDIEQMFNKLVISLKRNGILYASFKYGNNEVIRDDRLFNYYDETSLKNLLMSVLEMEIIDVWKTQDVLPGREGEAWVNCICRRV